MRKIPLTQNQFALVDDADFDWLSKYKWYARWAECTKSFYAVRNGKRTENKRQFIYMAREILGLKFGDKRQADHKNHDTLDNRRSNLRVCSKAENLKNQGKRKDNSSGFRGVHWHKRDRKWQTQIRCNGRKIYLGNFTSLIEAAKCYDKAAKLHHGEFAVLNFPKNCNN